MSENGPTQPSTNPESTDAPTAAPVQRDVVVIGGGIAGLVAALENARVGLRVTVIEAEGAPGGCLARQTVGGITVDSGAESFATRANTVADYLRSLGLVDAIVQPNQASSWLRLPSGDSIPMPKLSLLGIPASPLADDVRAAIGWRGALRAYADRLMPVLKIGLEANLGQLVKKRMGRAVLESLVTPIVGGVYSADPMQLSVEAVAPGLNAALTRTGSLSGAVAQLVASAPAGSRVAGIRGGMACLVDALVAELDKLGAEVLTNVRVESIQRLDPGTGGDLALQARWRVTANGSELDGVSTVVNASGIIVATPAAESLRLLSTASPAVPEWAALARLGWPEAPGVELVTLVVESASLNAAPRGTGVLTAATDISVKAKALTHVSAKWEWAAEAAQATGANRHVVRLSYGRAGGANPLVGLDDAAVRSTALADASAILGVELGEPQLIDAARTRWNNAIPVATVGAEERIAAVRAAVGEHDGIELAGSWLAGTGLARVIPDAREAGRRLRHGLVHTI